MMKKPDKKTILKIVIPLVIVIAVAGIWFWKNYDRKSDIELNTPLVQPVKEEHFVLNASELDMEAWKSYNLPIVLDFGSDSCLPCVSFYPTLKTVHAEMYGKVIIKYIDVYKYAKEASIYPVQVIPTQIFINADGTPYVPSKNIDVEFITYNFRNTDEHAYTVHEGVLTKDQFLFILRDMGVQE
jgi:thioredoxin 1